MYTLYVEFHISTCTHILTCSRWYQKTSYVQCYPSSLLISVVTHTHFHQPWHESMYMCILCICVYMLSWVVYIIIGKQERANYTVAQLAQFSVIYICFHFLWMMSDTVNVYVTLNLR